MTSPILQICCYFAQSDLNCARSEIEAVLPPERYSLVTFSSAERLIEVLTEHKLGCDCLVIFGEAPTLEKHLEEIELYTPRVLVSTHSRSTQLSLDDPRTAVSEIPPDRLADLPAAIDRAIARFIQLSPSSPPRADRVPPDGVMRLSLGAQQQRLSEKLKERLGYLGVYYKRDPKQFVRHLSPEDRQKYMERLQQIYRTIILEYFKDRPGGGTQNQVIDDFVNLAFLGDISVSQVLEIHMELMDDLAKQLKIEGRSEDILLDYRITLIDIIAHLCEMYRRSIPREP